MRHSHSVNQSTLRPFCSEDGRIEDPSSNDVGRRKSRRRAPFPAGHNLASRGPPLRNLRHLLLRFA